MVLARPVAVGLVQGLPGSTGVALVAVTTLPSRLAAAIYLCVVALVNVLGMVAINLIVSRPLAWTMRRDVKNAAALLAAGLGHRRGPLAPVRGVPR